MIVFQSRLIAALAVAVTNFSPLPSYGSDQSASCASLPPNAVAWWRFDGDGADSVGTNRAALSAEAEFAAGQVGQALSFDGSNTTAQSVAAAGLNVGAGDGLTIEGWIKPADFDHLRPIAEWNDGNGGIGVHFWVGVDTAEGSGHRSLFANLVDTDGRSHQIRSAAGLLASNLYQHVAVTYDKETGVAALFRNGEVVATGNLGSFTPQTTFALHFGHRPSGPFSGLRWKGELDEMTLYGRALTPPEVAAIAQAGGAGKCAPVEPPHCAPLPGGLAAWWPLNGDGSNVVSGGLAQIDGDPSFGPGVVGQGLLFDGQNDLLRVASSSATDLGAAEGLTIEGWIKPADLSHLRPIAEWNNGAGSVGVHLWTGVDVVTSGDGRRNLFANLVDTSGGSHQIYSPADLITANEYQHVALSYDKASGIAKLFRNGAVVATATLGAFTPQTTFDFALGTRLSGPFAEHRWAGAMDEMTLYRVALTEAEIGSIYAAGSAGKCPPAEPPPCPVPAGLVAWWRGEGDARDAAGSSHGELQQGTTFAPGMVGQGLVFDGEDDAVRIPASVALDVGAGEGLTIELWVKPDTLVSSMALLEWSSTVGPQPGLHFWTSGSGLFANLTDSAGVANHFLSPAGVLAAGVWQHVAFTYDRTSGVARFFVNGAEVAQRSFGSLRLETRPDLWLGRRILGGTPWAFDGAMDEVSLYGRALGASELLAIYEAGDRGKCRPVSPPPWPAYDLAGGFSPESNPAGPWSFGASKTLGGDFDLFTLHGMTQAEGGHPVDFWQLVRDLEPVIYRNPNSVPVRFAGGQGRVEPGGIWYYGGGEGATHAFGVVRFTVPRGGQGEYQVGALAEPVYESIQGDTDFHVLWNGHELFGRFLSGQASATFSNRLHLAAGDVLDFVIGPGRDGSVYASGLKLRAGLNQVSALLAEPPTIVTHPVGATLPEGGSVALRVDASGAAPLVYQWYHDGEAISGATTGTLHLSDLQPEQSGTYRVVVRNAGGEVISEAAAILVTPANAHPVARLRVGDLCSGIYTNVLISANGSNVCAVLDGSLSSDADGDVLDHVWLADSDGDGVPEPVGAGALATNCLEVGEHEMTLAVSDGRATAIAVETVQVITVCDAIKDLMLQVGESYLSRRSKRPIVSTLQAACQSFEAGRAWAGLNQLRAFSFKVRMTVMAEDPTRALQYMRATQSIIDAVRCDSQ